MVGVEADLEPTPATLGTRQENSPPHHQFITGHNAYIHKYIYTYTYSYTPMFLDSGRKPKNTLETPCELRLRIEPGFLLTLQLYVIAVYATYA